MAVGTESKIISVINQKTDSGAYVSYPIGPEQRYIGVLRKSNNNNLEEQLLMGVDRITTVTQEALGQNEHTEFKSTENADDTGYYILDSIVYREVADATNDYYVKDDVFYTTLYTTKVKENPDSDVTLTDVYFVEEDDVLQVNIDRALSVDNDVYIDNNRLLFANRTAQFNNEENAFEDIKGNSFMTINDDENSLLLSGTYTKRIDRLKFKQEDGNIVNISEKITTKEYKNNDVNIMKEVITNFL